MPGDFKKRVLKVVKKIKAGSFLTYKEVAKKAGNEKAARAVGNILAKNENPKIPCHRVIKSNNEVGFYKGSKKNTWEKVALLLKEGVIGIILTDKFSGIFGSALKRKSLEKFCKFKKEIFEGTPIILISSSKDLKIFKIKFKNWQKNFLKRTSAFSLPSSKEILKILKISGPLIFFNLERKKFLKLFSEIKRWLKEKVFYWKITNEFQANLIDLPKKEIKIKRKV